ncbi:MAG: hypothetical protein IBX55_00015 [Methyloprofundus sp.]|nr:hypothetical protein [Methyloprofundus sp.]
MSKHDISYHQGYVCAKNRDSLVSLDALKSSGIKGWKSLVDSAYLPDLGLQCVKKLLDETPVKQIGKSRQSFLFGVFQAKLENNARVLGA